jgi:hypothetical protein
VDGHPLRPAGIGPPADLDQPYHGKRGRLSAGQLPVAQTLASDEALYSLCAEELDGIE